MSEKPLRSPALSGLFPSSILHSRDFLPTASGDEDRHGAFRDGIPFPFTSWRHRLRELTGHLGWSHGQQEARCMKGLVKATFSCGTRRGTIGNIRAKLGFKVVKQLLIQGSRDRISLSAQQCLDRLTVFPSEELCTAESLYDF